MDVEILRLGKKGQLSVPKEVMARLGLRGGETLIVDVSDEGAIILRPAGVYPIEVYGEERIREFLEAYRLTDEERKNLFRLREASDD